MVQFLSQNALWGGYQQFAGNLDKRIRDLSMSRHTRRKSRTDERGVVYYVLSHPVG
jgi:hypothetical protein